MDNKAIDILFFLETMCIQEYGLVLVQPQNVSGLFRNKMRTRLPNVSKNMLVA